MNTNQHESGNQSLPAVAGSQELHAFLLADCQNGKAAHRAAATGPSHLKNSLFIEQIAFHVS